MKKEDLSFVDLEMLDFLSHRREDGALTVVAEAIIKADPDLKEIIAFHRKIFCKEKK